MSHTGRPLLRTNATHTLVLCPYGHLVCGQRRSDWAGSWLQARAADPTWTVECDGAVIRD